MDIRVPMEPVARAFGVDAVVSVQWKEPVTTRAIWMTPRMAEVPGGSGQQRMVPRKIMALLKKDVPEIPRGTTIDAPEVDGDAVKCWKVDAMDLVEFDHYRVVVIEKELFP